MARGKSANTENEMQKTSWSESYTSLILGMIVVGIIGFIIFSFINRNSSDTSSVSDEASEDQISKEEVTTPPATYTIVAGDDLWSISEQFYKSGYNWVDIAKENKLENPDVLHVGNKLSIPDVEPKKITVAESPKEAPVANAIKADNYTVVKGDYLWDIAVRAYSDGYKWVEIAKVNKLENPNLIFAGNKLKIPR
jgi:nucleoid-associated protein YgaU